MQKELRTLNQVGLNILEIDFLELFEKRLTSQSLNPPRRKAFKNKAKLNQAFQT